MKYNEGRRFDLLRQYRESVADSKVTNIGFSEHEKVTAEVQHKIIGVTTSTGEIVEKTTQHIVDRVIGCEAVKREGVPIQTVIDTLKNGTCDGKITYNSEGKPSIRFISAEATVTFNPQTKTAVQCTPKTRNKR